ncbi:hypothetical protein [Pelosinus propionicus]|uniref:Uncharacterized protein n=1 Tax=Pelosinus propionicus DSM 13327 TaxID=1123291 RepID=A0A1I4QE32_9FIRM|nr:hypothetical protein [Pelosinus propionicus]SFM38372.1 hypothetical protein SAMN04490355_109610 [Pelosinus propionicus DSM 13327]
MCDKRKREKDMNFTDFIEKNKDKIRKVAEANTVRNKKGIPVITKDDPWRNEKEWDITFSELNII